MSQDVTGIKRVRYDRVYRIFTLVDLASFVAIFVLGALYIQPWVRTRTENEQAVILVPIMMSLVIAVAVTVTLGVLASRWHHSKFTVVVTQVKELLQDPLCFRLWLCGSFDRDNVPIGQLADPKTHPIIYYLVNKSGLGCHGLELSGDSVKVAHMVDVPLPRWAAEFVRRLDYEYGGQDRVTAGDCLSVLDNMLSVG